MEKIDEIIRLFREGMLKVTSKNPSRTDFIWLSYAEAMVFLAEILSIEIKDFNKEEFYRKCGIEN